MMLFGNEAVWKSFFFSKFWINLEKKETWQDINDRMYITPKETGSEKVDGRGKDMEKAVGISPSIFSYSYMSKLLLTICGRVQRTERC